THSAILWALEEAIRKPFIFTPDERELNASMSDLVDAPPPRSTGNGRAHNGSSRTGQPSVPMQGPPGVPRQQGEGRLLTPTDIMRERRRREEQREADRREADRLRREEEERQRLQQPQGRQPQPAAAGDAIEPNQQGSGP